MLRRAKAASAEYTQRMSLVDHQPGAVTPRHCNEGRQIRNVAVHTVMTLDDYQRVSVARPQLGEQPVGGTVIEMGERHAPRAGQLGALDYTIVDQRVVD